MDFPCGYLSAPSDCSSLGGCRCRIVGRGVSLRSGHAGPFAACAGRGCRPAGDRRAGSIVSGSSSILFVSGTTDQAGADDQAAGRKTNDCPNPHGYFPFRSKAARRVAAAPPCPQCIPADQHGGECAAAGPRALKQILHHAWPDSARIFAPGAIEQLSFRFPKPPERMWTDSDQGIAAHAFGDEFARAGKMGNLSARRGKMGLSGLSPSPRRFSDRLLLLQTVERRQFPTQMIDQRLMRERLAGDVA